MLSGVEASLKCIVDDYYPWILYQMLNKYFSSKLKIIKPLEETCLMVNSIREYQAAEKIDVAKKSVYLIAWNHNDPSEIMMFCFRFEVCLCCIFCLFSPKRLQWCSDDSGVKIPGFKILIPLRIIYGTLSKSHNPSIFQFSHLNLYTCTSSVNHHLGTFKKCKFLAPA